MSEIIIPFVLLIINVFLTIYGVYSRKKGIIVGAFFLLLIIRAAARWLLNYLK